MGVLGISFFICAMLYVSMDFIWKMKCTGGKYCYNENGKIVKYISVYREIILKHEE